MFLKNVLLYILNYQLNFFSSLPAVRDSYEELIEEEVCHYITQLVANVG